MSPGHIAVLAAAALAAACATEIGSIDDGGRAAEDLFNAPVHDNDIVNVAAEPTIRVIDERVSTPLDGSQRGRGLESGSRPAAGDDERDNGAE